MESIYVDVLIIQNIAMNYFLLYLLGRLQNLNIKWWKLLIAAFIGSLYVLVLFLPSLHMFYSFIFKVMVSIIMVFLSFTPKTLRSTIKILFVFYAETFLLGGGIIGIFYLIYGDINTLNSAFLLSKISPMFVVIGSIITTLFVKIGFDVFEECSKETNCKIYLEVFVNGKSCTLKGFIDTGNYLRDPTNGSKVVVSYFKALENILPIEELKSLEKANELDYNIASRIRAIPYNAIGVENGILTGIKTDMIVAKSKNKVMINKGITIALHNKSFLGEGGYDAIAYPEILG